MMKPTKGEARIHIDAPPEKVYAAITDVTRMGEWSPECQRAEWLGGATEATVGARFKGSNKRGRMKWSTKPEVTAADPGREFAFKTPQTQWSYRLAASNGGTEVVESYNVYKLPPALIGWFFSTMAGIKDRDAELQVDMQQTLSRLKAAVEGSA